MNLLINEPPLQVLPSLAKKVGLNEAILLQQLHFRSLISTNIRDGHRWVYKTYEEWKEDEFPFWSVDTIKRSIRKLEKEGYVISTSAYNRMKMDKTKWYRINYSMCRLQTGQIAPSEGAGCTEGEGHVTSSDEGKLPLAITKEFKSTKKEYVEKDLDVLSVIDYLNKKTGKNFKSASKATQRFVNGRMREGYVIEDFKRVIDSKVKEWLNDPYWNKYLRPSTLFSPTNFENYLEEMKDVKTTGTFVKKNIQPPQLDFGKGEE